MSTNGTIDDKLITVRTAWFRDMLPLFMMVISGLVWGMKLEARADRNAENTEELRTEVTRLRAEISSGILPVAKERIDGLSSRLYAVERHLANEKERGDHQ